MSVQTASGGGDAHLDADPEAELDLVARAAETRWSGAFTIAPSAFVAYVVARRSPGASRAVSEQHAADLYLACACSLGVSGAITVFEGILQCEVRAALQHMRLQPAAVDEVCQMTREKLLVGSPERAPRITEYSGHGSLRGWLRVVVTRIAINTLRAQKPEVPLEDVLVELDATGAGDPELACLRERFGASLRSALDHAMQLLSSEDRLLLRQRYVDGLTTLQLAALYRRHRISITRRITTILRLIRVRTEAFLEDEVGCGRSTAVSIVNQALSQAHLSLHRYLAPQE